LEDVLPNLNIILRTSVALLMAKLSAVSGRVASAPNFFLKKEKRIAYL
jgi:hypothetical protein